MSEKNWEVGSIIGLDDVIRWDGKATPENLQTIINQLENGEITVEEANKWASSITITLTGDVAGSISFDGSSNGSLSVTIRKATQSEAEAGTVDNRFMTPLRTKQAIDQLRRFATTAQAEAGTLENVVMNPKTTKESILANAPAPDLSAYDNHIDNKNNPHETTKQQVGLASVQNYAVATQSQAEAATLNSVYMTPLRTAQAINVLRSFATQSQAETGTNSNTVMTPQRTVQAIEALATSTLVNKITQTFTNESPPQDYPIGITQTYFGSGFPLINFGIILTMRAHNGARNTVQYMQNLNSPNETYTRRATGLNGWTEWKRQASFDDIATQNQAESAMNNETFLTPLRGKQLIDSEIRRSPSQSTTALSAYRNGIYMSNVANDSSYPNSNGTLLTVKISDNRTFQMFVWAHGSNNFQLAMRHGHTAINGDWSTWQEIAKVEDITNAINELTKSNVGLSSVENFPIATNSQAIIGTHTGSYMTPQRTAQAIEALAISNTINRIPNNSRDNDSLASDFPNGITIMHSGTSAGFPSNYGILVTFRTSNRYAHQEYTTISGSYQTFTRVSTSDSGTWGAWRKVLASDNATKSDVGLGNVENYPVATAGQAIGGVNNTTYMTPQRVAQYVNRASGLSSLDSLDDITTAGKYTMSNLPLTGNLVNSLPGQLAQYDTDWRDGITLFVEELFNGRAYQRLITGGGLEYSRTQVGSSNLGWGRWKFPNYMWDQT